MNSKRYLALAVAVFAAATCLAQKREVEWTGKLVPEDARAGESAQLVLTGTIREGWHTYSIVPVEGI
ncbi:MAG TPA: hypothetical protein VFG65_01735, partial [Fimbriimonadales bacterium]|nr:hypothetical protein [Fimbriimonadales bacterium]